MSEVHLKLRSPLEGLELPKKVGFVSVTEAPFGARFLYRGAPADLADRFAVPLPIEPLQAASDGRCCRCRL